MTIHRQPGGNDRNIQAGFSLIELLVAATIFTFVVTAVSSLFAQALQLQRRAQGVQKIDENAMYTIESMSREIRVSRILSGDAPCDGPPNASNYTLELEHPVNGNVVYRYDPVSKSLNRTVNQGIPAQISAPDVQFTRFAFCVSGSERDRLQTRVTMPMTIQASVQNSKTSVAVSLQTTVASRDLSQDFGL